MLKAILFGHERSETLPRCFVLTSCSIIESFLRSASLDEMNKSIETQLDHEAMRAPLDWQRHTVIAEFTNGAAATVQYASVGISSGS